MKKIIKVVSYVLAAIPVISTGISASICGVIALDKSMAILVAIGSLSSFMVCLTYYGKVAFSIENAIDGIIYGEE